MTTAAHAVDERAHAAALSAAVAANIGAWGVYGYGEVPGMNGNPGSIPEIYVLLQVERTFLPATRQSRLASRTGWRAVVRGVGSTPTEMRWAMNRIHLSLDSQRLTVDGFTSTPVAFESGGEDDDPRTDGRCSAFARYTYAL